MPKNDTELQNIPDEMLPDQDPEPTPEPVPDPVEPYRQIAAAMHDRDELIADILEELILLEMEV